MLLIRRHLALLLLLTAASTTVAADEGCPLRSGLELPDSAYSGAWNHGVLTFVDVLDDELMAYSADRGLLNRKPLTAVPALQAFQPQAVRVAADGELLVQLNQGRLVTLNTSLHPTRLHRLIPPQPVGDGERNEELATFYAWDVAERDLIVCGDVRRGTNWDAGFLRAPLDDLQDFRFLGERRSLVDAELIYCRIGYDYIATLGADAYILMDGRDGRTTEIHLFPEDGQPSVLKATFPPRPKLSEFTGPEVLPRTMNQLIPSAHMPAGLYAWQGRLYVLTRRPENGVTVWELHQVDPATGEVEGFARLPGNADHLTVVPGATWGVLERGSVRGFQNFESTGLRFVPGSAIERIGQLDGQLVCAE